MRNKNGNITLNIYYPQDGETKPTVFIHPNNLAKDLPTNAKDMLTKRYNGAKKQLEEIEGKENKAGKQQVKEELASWRDANSSRAVPSAGILQLLNNYQIPRLDQQLEEQPNTQKKIELLEQKLKYVNKEKIMKGELDCSKIDLSSEKQKHSPLEKQELPSFLIDHRR